MAEQRSVIDTEPQRQALEQTRLALAEKQSQLDKLADVVTSESVGVDLLTVLNERARNLRLERETLRLEMRKLSDSLRPLVNYFTPKPLQKVLGNFALLASHAEPAELHSLVRLTIRRIEWMPDGSHEVEFFVLPQATPKASHKAPVAPLHRPPEALIDESLLTQNKVLIMPKTGEWALRRGSKVMYSRMRPNTPVLNHLFLG